LVKQQNSKSKKDRFIMVYFMRTVIPYRIKLKKWKKKAIIKNLYLVVVNKGFNIESKKRALKINCKVKINSFRSKKKQKRK